MRRRAVMIVVLVWMLVGCVQERPNWYFATGEIIHGPYECAHVRLAGWELRAGDRSARIDLLAGTTGTARLVRHPAREVT